MLLMEDFFFLFLVTFALIFIRKPVCGLPLSITQLLLLEFKNVYRPHGPVCVSPLMNWAPNQATSGRKGSGIEAGSVFKLLSSYISVFLPGFQIFNLLNSLQTFIFIPTEEVVSVRTGSSPVLPMGKLRQQC